MTVLRSITVRSLAIVVACALSSRASADTAAQLQASGEELAKSGRFGEAIAKFKEADKLEPRATFACLIALAYTRKENWPQAELYLSLCHERARSGEKLPDWVPLADQQIKDRLQGAGVVAVTIRVVPANAVATLTVSSFAPDEKFGPRTIYLPPGTHAIVAHAAGHDDVKQVIEIKTGAQPMEVVIDLDAKPVVVAPVGPTRGGKLLVAGAIVAGAGMVSYAVFGFAWSKERSISDSDPTNDGDYTKYYDLYTVTRISTIALWSVGAGLAIGGLVLRATGSREVPAVTFAPTRGGGVIGLGWQR